MLSPAPWPSPTWLPLASASLRVSKIASFGHSGRQAPQEIHSSVISNAMTLASFYTTIETHTVDKFTPSRPLCVARCDRHSSPPLFSKSTERHLLRRPRFPVLMGLWAQGIVMSCESGNIYGHCIGERWGAEKEAHYRSEEHTSELQSHSFISN